MIIQKKEGHWYKYKEKYTDEWQIMLTNEYGDDIGVDNSMTPKIALEEFARMVEAERGIYNAVLRDGKLVMTEQMRDLLGEAVDISTEDFGEKLNLDDLDFLFGNYVTDHIWKDMLCLLMYDWVNLDIEDIFPPEDEGYADEDPSCTCAMGIIIRCSTFAVLTKLGYDIRKLGVKDDIVKKFENMPIGIF